jgi:hypothetical protein
MDTPIPAAWQVLDATELQHMHTAVQYRPLQETPNILCLKHLNSVDNT